MARLGPPRSRTTSAHVYAFTQHLTRSTASHLPKLRAGHSSNVLGHITPQTCSVICYLSGSVQFQGCQCNCGGRSSTSVSSTTFSFSYASVHAPREAHQKLGLGLELWLQHQRLGLMQSDMGALYIPSYTVYAYPYICSWLSLPAARRCPHSCTFGLAQRREVFSSHPWSPGP